MDNTKEYYCRLEEEKLRYVTRQITYSEYQQLVEQLQEELLGGEL